MIAINNKWLAVLISALILAVSGTTYAAGDAATGKTKAASCASCHGADGNSVNPIWPSLAGQHASYIVKQLKDFKSGKRENPTMAPMAAPLSDQDIEDLAAFFSAQKAGMGTANPNLVSLGEKIYRGGNSETGLAACMGCHNPGGTGNPAARFPSLSGQQSAYTVAQLKAFRDGQRANDQASMMRDIAAKMTEKEMQAVASYIQGLH